MQPVACQRVSAMVLTVLQFLRPAASLPKCEILQAAVAASRVWLNFNDALNWRCWCVWPAAHWLRIPGLVPGVQICTHQWFQTGVETRLNSWGTFITHSLTLLSTCHYNKCQSLYPRHEQHFPISQPINLLSSLNSADSDLKTDLSLFSRAGTFFSML